MSFALRNIKNVDASTVAKITELGKQAVKQTYQSQLIDLDFQKDNLVESPDNLYKIGISEVDDLFVVDLDGSQGETLSTIAIMNGANLKMVNVFRVQLSNQDPAKADENFLKSFQRAALEAFPNPNIYPKSNPQHYADLLYVLSKKREEDPNLSLTCENAAEIFKYFTPTAELYRVATARGTDKIVGTQGEVHQMSSRLAESEEKTKVIQDCANEAKAHFEIAYDFGKISPENQERIKKAVDSAGLPEMLQKYTNKPVSLRFTLESGSEINLRLTLRFDRVRYSAWTKDRVPMKFRTYQILSLDPYYALMQKMIIMKTSLPSDSPAPLVRSFEEMKMTLALSTLLNGEISFGVDGKYAAERKAMKMGYPNSIRLTAPGFDAKTIENKSKELFQEKGWIALGSCKTIDGTITEDGLLYKFFGFPCN